MTFLKIYASETMASLLQKNIFIFLGVILATASFHANAQTESVQNFAEHKNLKVFVLKGEQEIQRKYISLEEAMEKKFIKLHETGDVNRLEADNVSDQFIFIMAGDIVKGGKQDRTMAEDVILRPKSKKISLNAFCVESNRWRQRGSESDVKFSSSSNMLSDRKQKIAARESSSQHEVWDSVSEFQSKASRNINENVKSRESESSLQLTLENKKLKASIEEYIKAIQPLFDGHKDALGFAFFVNGRISTVEKFGNASLFQSLQKKLLQAAAGEALAHMNDTTTYEAKENMTLEDFIAYAESKGTIEEEITRKVSENTKEKKRKTDKTILFSVFDADVSDEISVHTSIYSTDALTRADSAAQHDFQYGGNSGRMDHRAIPIPRTNRD